MLLRRDRCPAGITTDRRSWRSRIRRQNANAATFAVHSRDQTAAIFEEDSVRLGAMSAMRAGNFPRSHDSGNGWDSLPNHRRHSLRTQDLGDPRQKRRQRCGGKASAIRGHWLRNHAPQARRLTRERKCCQFFSTRNAERCIRAKLPLERES